MRHRTPLCRICRRENHNQHELFNTTTDFRILTATK